MKIALKGIIKEWQNLAEALGLPSEEIIAIKANNPSDVKQCVNEVVDGWFKWKAEKKPSWSNLYEALKDPTVNRKDIASEIKNIYMHK